MNRSARRRDIARFRREACRELLTYLVEPDDPALGDVPLLQRAARWWLDGLSTRVRHCIVCSSWIINQQHVGALLLATPAVARPPSASACGICRQCWSADIPVETLERAAIAALQPALPGAHFG
jgi:hypothetical protein